MHNPSQNPYEPPPVVGLLRGAYQLARDLVKGYPVTGWRWRRPRRECPNWCARDHTCTVRPVYGLGPNHDGYQLPGPMSEHRSPSTTWKPEYGSLTATRVQNLSTGARVELRLQVRLSDTSDKLAFAQALYLPLAVDAAVRTLLAELELAARMRARELRAEEDLRSLAGSTQRGLPRGRA